MYIDFTKDCWKISNFKSTNFDFEIFYSGIMENHEAEIRNSEMKSSLDQTTKF